MTDGWRELRVPTIVLPGSAHSLEEVMEWVAKLIWSVKISKMGEKVVKVKKSGGKEVVICR